MHLQQNTDWSLNSDENLQWLYTGTGNNSAQNYNDTYFTQSV